jgi:hypothetical protein
MSSQMRSRFERSKPGAALCAIRQLLAIAPLPDSNLTHMRWHEREYQTLLEERGPEVAEAAMVEVYASELRRRQGSAP